MRRLGEIALIGEYLAPLASSPESLGLRDDAAFLAKAPANGLVMTADAIVAGVHFFEDDDPADVAYKALAVNVSDLAAKAATPLGYLMTLALPEAPSEEWARSLTQGLAAAQSTFGIALWGGDTVAARGAWWMSITALGEASARGILPRGGAKPGDRLYVSGTIGDAALGLKSRLGHEGFAALAEDDRRFLRGRYLRPEPRLALREALAACANAAMDISDGLVLDLTRMCAASGVSATLHAFAVPVSGAGKRALRASSELIDTVLTGGDDYEILAAVPHGKAADFEAASREAGVAVTRIGEIEAGDASPRILDRNGLPLALSAKGFEHFRS